LRDPGSDIVKGTVSAKWLWEMILDTRIRTGEPYIHWIDTSNRLMPEHSKQQGLVVSQSNICVTGDTIIRVKDGDAVEDISIHDYIEKWEFGYYNNPHVWSFDGNEWKWAKIDMAAKTALVDELIEIEYEGRTLRCTPAHKILTKNRGYVEAQYLEENDELVV
jgi:ribonucleotide reductase alpha subunit